MSSFFGTTDSWPDSPSGGGQASPLYERKVCVAHPGMSLREWYAGQALAGMLAHATRYRPEDAALHWHDAMAKEAYEIADAMLRGR